MYSSVKLVHVFKPNATVTVEELNDELFTLHIPALVFVVVCMILGIIGNGLVLIVYKRNFNRSNHRYFILFLAVIDLLACATGLPYLIYSLRLPYMMTSVITCKTLRYIHYLVNNSSAILLLVIAVERYRKICRPLKSQLSHKQTLHICLGMILFSAVIAIPAPIFFGANTIETGVNNITGTQCYVEDNLKGSPMFEFYMGLLTIETGVCIIVFAVLYTFIIRKLLQSDQFMSAMRSMHYNSSSRHDTSFSTDGNMDYPDKIDSEYDTCNDSDATLAYSNKNIDEEMTNASTNTQSPEISNGSSDINLRGGSLDKASKTDRAKSLIMSSANSVSTGISEESPTQDSQWSMSKRLFKKNQHDHKGPSKYILNRAVSDTTLNRVGGGQIPIKSRTLTPVEKKAHDQLCAKHKKSKVKSKAKKNTRTTIRVTVMLCTVSLVFVIAFIPHLTLMIITFHNKAFLSSMTAAELMAYQFFLRIFIINNVANPYIYLFCDRKFRTGSKEFIRHFFCCMKRFVKK